jgi:hypothetical protein
MYFTWNQFSCKCFHFWSSPKIWSLPQMVSVNWINFFLMWQGQMDHTPKNSWLPPTPLHQEGHPRGLMGIQDQGWCRTGDIRVKKDIRMMGEKQDKNTTRITGRHHNGTPRTQSQLWQRRMCNWHAGIRITLLSGDRIGSPRSIWIQRRIHGRRRIMW